MRLFIALLLLCASCAHKPLPPSFPFSSKQCEPVREFACVASNPSELSWCQTHTDAALAEINAAAGRVVARRVPYGPGVSPLLIISPKEVQDITKVPSGVVVLGVTMVRRDDATLCLGVTPIAFNSLMLTSDWFSPWSASIVLHELLHALGGEHSNEGAASVLTPNCADPLHSLHLSERDKSTVAEQYK